MHLLDLIHQKLELFRLEQRYTRRRNRRSTFVSEAQYGKQREQAEEETEHHGVGLEEREGRQMTKSPKIAQTTSSYYEINQKLAKAKKELIAKNQIKWLKAAENWDSFDNSWRTRKLLGVGTFGICALLEYHGDDPNMPRSLVVKQSGPLHAGELEWESKFLRQLTGTGTQHVVKLYKSVYKGVGAGISDKFYPSPIDEEGDYNDLLTLEWHSGFQASKPRNGSKRHNRDPRCKNRTFGKEILCNPKYTKHLTDLILRCIIYDLLQRPTPASLLRETGDVLEQFWNPTCMGTNLPTETSLYTRTRTPPNHDPSGLELDIGSPKYPETDWPMTPELSSIPLIFDEPGDSTARTAPRSSRPPPSQSAATTTAASAQSYLGSASLTPRPPSAALVSWSQNDEEGEEEQEQEQEEEGEEDIDMSGMGNVPVRCGPHNRPLPPGYNSDDEA
ncbi:hypothetical protein G7Y89_g6940 [Cudoniella acicularis]|uniref:Protein kinase domain-containing protein n=1 Tax=Cudoniella acicularis TaxID=354080 RepID=A0A8H4RJH5_9HELO|nr:hypothetical protein G7Y89_g6940 [Cudoniella acicularis]